MRRKMLWIGLLGPLFGSSLYAQDIAGDWQGTLKTGGPELRIILKITKETEGVFKSTLYSIDQGTDGIAANSVTLQDSVLKITFDRDMLKGVYEGKISADGGSLDGTWTQGRPLPLQLARATQETAWQIDPTSHGLQFMAVDKDVKLECSIGAALDGLWFCWQASETTLTYLISSRRNLLLRTMFMALRGGDLAPPALQPPDTRPISLVTTSWW
jgi:hypothetical protein